MTLGFEKAYSPTLNIGLMATYRTLKSSNDDFCDQRPIDAWGLRNSVDTPATSASLARSSIRAKRTG